jgi:hypothetical protein
MTDVNVPDFDLLQLPKTPAEKRRNSTCAGDGTSSLARQLPKGTGLACRGSAR